MSEHACPRCGVLHEGDAETAVWHSRCSNCGALNRAPKEGQALEKTACRRCARSGMLVALQDIPDAVGRYPGLTKTERGYEVVDKTV
jgi:DNA-directed RNA polymerase subunit RPC12/RpoP